MNSTTTPISTSTATELERRLRSAVRGGVRFDRLYRALYATDASIYEIAPLGVVLPKDATDVSATVCICRELGIPIVPRGAGTGLTGGAVGHGLLIDFSRHMNRIGPVDLDRRTVAVDPGVVLDELNAFMKPLGLKFAPDVATSSRATIGGMIANNSCGAGSVLHGRTVDHVLSLACILSDGTLVEFGSGKHPGGSEPSGTSATPIADTPSHRAASIERALANIRVSHQDEILARFPKVLRSNGGYGLDRLGRAGTHADACKILCGSEGTLSLILGATLKLVPIPKHTGLCVLHFRGVLDAVAATPAILKHGPAAIELIDRLILDASRANAALATKYGFLSGDPGALLIVEFTDEDAKALTLRFEAFLGDPLVLAASYAAPILTDSLQQAEVWKIRTNGLGLLMSKPGDEQPYSFVEDTAVDPARLRDYLERFGQILDAENVHAGYYAHASVGCIHVKPVLNLRTSTGVQQMRRIADAVSNLALEFGGAFTGEHGDGIIRSSFLEKMYGPRIIAAFREVKQLFDPHNLFNPHKIVDPWSMTAHLRFRQADEPLPVKTVLDFSLYGGNSPATGMAGLAGMCSGVGQCRQQLVGTMCPSYAATGDELHSTRARANALRIALSNQGLLSGLDDPALDEVMDLCLSCKACKSECPTGVDMARLKAEFRFRKNLVQGVSRRARFIAELPDRLRAWSRFPRLATWIARSRMIRAVLQHRLGLDARISPPPFARQTFRTWFQRRAKEIAPRPAPRGPVIYFVDTWTNYFTPDVGIAAVTLLETAGFRVFCPPFHCCGRPAISQGLLLDAKQSALANLRRLASFDPLSKMGTTTASHPLSSLMPNDDIPILGSEPSCLLTLVDEYPQLVRTPFARRVAQRAMLVDTFLAKLLRHEPGALRFAAPVTPMLYHPHCHQKALVGSDDALTLLRAAYGNRVSEMNGGCCGMAGTFGHEKEHYDVARAIGEQRLFPAVRGRGDSEIAVSGFSCRQQIEHHTDAGPRHLLEHVGALLVPA